VVRDRVKQTANSLSYWSEPVKEEVQHKFIHLFALVLYAAGMLLFVIWAAINFATFPLPTVFESAPANDFAPVALEFAIDCQDCRVVPGIPGQGAPAGVPSEWNDKQTLFILAWDYTSVPGGCAARSPALFSDQLREHCAAQNTAAGRTGLADPLDRCTIKNTDLALLTRSKSPDPRIAPTVNVSWRPGWGLNPNYGGGSFYELQHGVPLCFVDDVNARSGGGESPSKGLQLTMTNIPHHAFTSQNLIGQAVVSIATPDGKFREERVFQPWHKNTLHLGLTVERDAAKRVEEVRVSP
jgi:hypothetical protein